ncbi:MAG: methylenetetrahydrofolate--tRNA-(uracil-5-)-methyltransferase [bacterium]|jgi:methylenetetrahydrofolate--tRNA-(uracil-5-)-methyltransferase
MSKSQKIAIIGGGLAGCEASWQLAKRDFSVTLFEMRPQEKTPAHQTENLAELVCSNSFKSEDISNAHGLLKAELALHDSLIIQSAKKSSVPAGSALAVDRKIFSKAIEKKLAELPTLTIIKKEITSISDLQKEFDHIIIATGPLTSDPLAKSIQELLGEESLAFFDSIAPVVFADSINMDIAFKAARYDKGDADYINCPLNIREYENFIEGLLIAKKVPFKEFEKAKYFEGCLPIEVMAERGHKTLSFGPMKPVGFEDPRTGEQSEAILQLRQENESGSLYNLVGCQTKMTYPEQERVFRMVPGLENCEFARLGSIHRNTYIKTPVHLNSCLEIKKAEGIYLAGQITGVEGYTESTAIGLWVALNIIQKIEEKPTLKPNSQTMIGGLINYLMTASPDNFQPMNSNFGLIESIQVSRTTSKKDKRQMVAERALQVWKDLDLN